MLQNLTPFLLHWGNTALSLRVASHVFSGLLSIVIGSFIDSGTPETTIQMPHNGVWL